MGLKKLTAARLARIAGTLLLMAGAIAFMSIITAESLYPTVYTTGGSEISDLGGTDPPNSIIVQPSAAIFDTAMMVTGVFLIVGSGCAYAAYRRKSLAIPLALFGIGALGVGIFPGYTGGTHLIFAELTFISGAVAAILSYRLLAGPLRYIAVLLGAIALVNTIAYTFLQESWFVAAGLGIGGLERWIVYPVLLWTIGLGGYLLGMRDQASPVSVNRR